MNRSLLLLSLALSGHILSCSPKTDSPTTRLPTTGELDIGTPNSGSTTATGHEVSGNCGGYEGDRYLNYDSACPGGVRAEIVITSTGAAWLTRENCQIVPSPAAVRIQRPKFSDNSIALYNQRLFSSNGPLYSPALYCENSSPTDDNWVAVAPDFVCDTSVGCGYPVTGWVGGGPLFELASLDTAFGEVFFCGPLMKLSYRPQSATAMAEIFSPPPVWIPLDSCYHP